MQKKRLHILVFKCRNPMFSGGCLPLPGEQDLPQVLGERHQPPGNEEQGQARQSHRQGQVCLFGLGNIVPLLRVLFHIPISLLKLWRKLIFLADCIDCCWFRMSPKSTHLEKNMLHNPIYYAFRERILESNCNSCFSSFIISTTKLTKN